MAQIVQRRAAASVAWTLAGLAGAAASQFVVVLVLARGAGTVAVGQFALGQAVATPPLLLSALSLRTVLVTDTDAAATFGRYLRLRLAGAGGALVVIAAVAVVVGGHSGWVVVLVGAAKAFDAVTDIYIGLFQFHERMRRAAVGLLLNATITVAATLALAVYAPGAVGAAVGSAIGSLVAAGVYCPLAARPLRAPARPPGAASARLVRVALPIGLASAIAALAASVPRLVIAYRLDLDALGAFTAIGYVLLAANTAASATCQAVLPRMARDFAAGDGHGLRRMTAGLSGAAAGAGALLAVVGAAAGGPLLALVYGPPYRPHGTVLVLFCLAAGVSGVSFVMGTALAAARRFPAQLFASCVSLVAAAGLAWALVPHGLLAAAWALLLGLALDAAVKAALLARTPRAPRVADNTVPAVPALAVPADGRA
jgi:O-antigen/teichoic acid export membrane protein